MVTANAADRGGVVGAVAANAGDRGGVVGAVTPQTAAVWSAPSYESARTSRTITTTTTAVIRT